MRPIKALLGLACFGAAMATNANAAIITVHVFDFDFSTNTAAGPIVDPTINLNDTIHWVWDSGMHSVTSVAGSTQPLNSGVWMDVGHTYDHTYTQTGTFSYYCTVHGFDNGNGTAGGMAGTITVVPEPVTCLAMAAGIAGLAARRRRKA
jgi:plastocyanin